MIAINKADGDNVARAATAAAEYRAALHILTPRSANWTPPVISYSALTGAGLTKLWTQVREHRQRMTDSGELTARRREQQVKWMYAMLEERLFARLRSDAAVRAKLKQAEAAVASGRLAATLAVEQIAAALGTLTTWLWGRGRRSLLCIEPFHCGDISGASLTHVFTGFCAMAAHESWPEN